MHIRKSPRAFAALVVALSALAWVVATSTGWFVRDVTISLPNRGEVRRIGEMARATTIFDRHDRPIFTLYKEQRIEVLLADVSPHVVRAIIAVEDQRFYEHPGVDAIRVAAAAVANAREGRAVQGGSTLTQQLARLSFLTPAKTMRRKLQEVILAAQIERSHSKPEILELYLNKVYFGNGLYGVEAASRGYFGKHASELTLAEGALLAGLLKAPSTHAPTVDLDRARRRRKLVLDAMLDMKAISRSQWASASSEPVVLRDALQTDDPPGLHFKEEIRQALVQKFGPERVYEGGLLVYSTLDLDLQKTAERLVDESLAGIEKRRASVRMRTPKRGGEPGTPDEDRLEGALIAMDVATGHVLAMVGGRDYARSRFNRALQARRQPGSAFKPFVYAAALESGYSPSSIIDRLDQPIDTLQGAWMPEDGHSRGSAMTLRAALKTSSNRAAVRLLEAVGVEQAVEYAVRLGVGSQPSVPSLALGTGEVTLGAMTAAYGAFANGGLVNEPTMIRRVTDRDGTVLFEEKLQPRRAIGEATAFLMATMLADVVNHGTAYRARAAGFKLPAGGKTGTTNEFADAWFVGFTPRVVTGVWIGFDRPHTILPNGFAGDLAVPLWAKFMTAATRGHDDRWLSPPADIVTVNVCRVSGKLPVDGCWNVQTISFEGFVETKSQVATDYFVRGSEPTSYCPVHQFPMTYTAGAESVAGTSGVQEAQSERIPGGLPPPPPELAPGDPSPPPEVETMPAPQQRRGFWSRIFGGRGKKPPPKQNKPPEKPPGDR